MHSVPFGGATTSAASHCHSSEDSASRSGLSGLDWQCGSFGQTALLVSSKHPLEQSPAERAMATLPAAQGVSAEPGFGSDSPSFTHRHRHRAGTLYGLYCVLLL